MRNIVCSSIKISKLAIWFEIRIEGLVGPLPIFAIFAGLNPGSSMVILAYLLIVLAGLLVLGNLLTYPFQDFFIFRPRRLGADAVIKFEQPFEELMLTTERGGRLHAAWFRKKESRGVILYFHGNSGNLSRWGNLYHYFFRYGYDFFIYDYRGFGRSRGYRNEQLMQQDARRVYDRLREAYAAEKIVIYGRSIGTAFATRLAADVPARMLILETPFASMPDLFYTYYPFLPRLFWFKYRFDNRRYLPEVNCPVYIFQGTDDLIVPFSSAAKLQTALKPDDHFFTIDMGRHNDLMVYERYHQKIEEILK